MGHVPAGEWTTHLEINLAGCWLALAGPLLPPAPLLSHCSSWPWLLALHEAPSLSLPKKMDLEVMVVVKAGEGGCGEYPFLKSKPQSPQVSPTEALNTPPLHAPAF